MSSEYDARFFQKAEQNKEDILYGETGILAQLEEQDTKARPALEGALENKRYHAASAIFQNLREDCSLNLSE